MYTLVRKRERARSSIPLGFISIALFVCLKLLHLLFPVLQVALPLCSVFKLLVVLNHTVTAMTILPKKKTEQQKDSDNEQSSDHSASPHGASGHIAHSSPHPLESPYDDSFSPHHHRGSPETFYHRCVCVCLFPTANRSSVVYLECGSCCFSLYT